MYPVSSDARTAYLLGNRQVARITIGNLVLTEADIVEGGLNINRYSTTGDNIEIGSVISAEATLTLENKDGRFNEVSFSNREMYIEIGVVIDDDTTEYMPVGYFLIDNAPRALDKIEISSLDRMMRLQKEVPENTIEFPITIQDMLDVVCDECEVDLAEAISSLPNATYTVTNPPRRYGTYRDMVEWIAEITGTCAYFDENGELAFQWYTEADETITTHERYNSDVFEDVLTVTGVQILDGDKSYSAGEEGFVLSISNNPLIQTNQKEVAENILTFVSDTSIRPFSAETLPMPYLYPLDVITFVNKDSVAFSVAITDTLVTLNQSTMLKGRGEVGKNTGFGRENNRTKDEEEIISELDKVTDDMPSFYQFRNTSAISITTEELNTMLFRLQLVSKTKTYIQVHMEINLNTTDNDDDGVTYTMVTYKEDEVETQSIHPKESYIDGDHVLHLMYVCEMEPYITKYFVAEMQCSGGTVTIPPYGIWVTAYGNGLLVEEKWDGNIIVTERCPVVEITNDIEVAPLDDSYVIEISEVQKEFIEETVSVITIPQTLQVRGANDLPIIGRKSVTLTINPLRASEYTFHANFVNVTDTAFALRTDYTYVGDIAEVDSGYASAITVPISDYDTIDTIEVRDETSD